MLDTILRSFPAHTDLLTLVSDPDNILGDPEVRAVLVERDFRLIEQSDTIALRADIEHARPFTAASPVVIITREPVNALPYDLWQHGHHFQLSLVVFFPRLDPDVVRMLSPRQRRHLSDMPPEQTPGAHHDLPPPL